MCERESALRAAAFVLINDPRRTLNIGVWWEYHKGELSSAVLGWGRVIPLKRFSTQKKLTPFKEILSASHECDWTTRRWWLWWSLSDAAIEFIYSSPLNMTFNYSAFMQKRRFKHLKLRETWKKKIYIFAMLSRASLIMIHTKRCNRYLHIFLAPNKHGSITQSVRCSGMHIVYSQLRHRQSLKWKIYFSADKVSTRLGTWLNVSHPISSRERFRETLRKIYKRWNRVRFFGYIRAAPIVVGVCDGGGDDDGNPSHAKLKANTINTWIWDANTTTTTKIVCSIYETTRNLFNRDVKMLDDVVQSEEERSETQNTRRWKSSIFTLRLSRKHLTHDLTT